MGGRGRPEGSGGTWGDLGWREGAGGWEFFRASSVAAALRSGLGLPPLSWRLSGV